jgi:hypothetical protein
MKRTKTKQKPVESQAQDKDGLRINALNPGLVMGRSIAFAKFTHENYVLFDMEEPSWLSRSKADNILHSSCELYTAYLNWLKN